MNSTPLISVVIPTHDREPLLLDCLESVLNQSYPALEVLIIDQNPKRTLQEIIRQRMHADSRTRYFCLEHGGASRARNLGVEHANGSIIAFIDDDAIADSNWLAGIAEAFAAIPQPALVAGRIDPIWVAKRPNWYPQEREFLLGLYNIGDQMRPMPDDDLPVGANMAGLRNVILQMGGFDERFGPHYFRRRPMLTGEETLLGMRIKQHGYPIHYQPKATVRHRIEASKLTRKYFLRRHFWEGVTTIERMATLGQVTPDKRGHYRYHTRAVGMALARFLLPGFENRYAFPRPVIRMLALARASFNAGVLYGLATLTNNGALEEKRCASA